jgi:pyroglutamyl-peptidase
MKVILTGFTPFGDLGVNPSQLVVKRIAECQHELSGIELTAEILPTAFADAGERIRQLIRRVVPDAVLSIGVAASRDAINLERFALNINDAPIPDNNGKLATGQPIVSDGPIAYQSTLPLQRMYGALEERGIPTTYSNHAGAYVCNHVFYCGRHELDLLKSEALCGFIHIPMMSEAADQPGAEQGLPLATMVEAIVTCTQILAT